MSAALFTCPECQQEHALYWKVEANGKRKLYVNCNKATYQAKTNDGPEFRTSCRAVCVHNEVLAVMHKKTKDIPEVYSKGWARKKKEEQTCNLRFD